MQLVQHFVLKAPFCLTFYLFLLLVLLQMGGVICLEGPPSFYHAIKPQPMNHFSTWLYFIAIICFQGVLFFMKATTYSHTSLQIIVRGWDLMHSINTHLPTWLSSSINHCHPSMCCCIEQIHCLSPLTFSIYTWTTCLFIHF